MEKQIFFSKVKYKANRKKEEAAKQLYIHYIEENGDGEVVGGHLTVVTGWN